MFKEKSKKFYDAVAQVYDGDIKLSKRPVSTHQAVLHKLNSGPYTSILDIGFGTGTLLEQIAQNKNILIAGIDISPEMVRTAKKKIGYRADLRTGDSEVLPWPDNNFDAVLCTYSFHHYPNPSMVVSEIRRVLKPGGRLIVSDCWSRTPMRQLSNLLTPLCKDGDFHVYSKSEICGLVIDCGFITAEWELINNKAFLLTATGTK